MAPKRGSTAAAPAAKKAKTRAPEAPLLSFLDKCDEIPKPCREMLQAALPICLEVVEADRHKFQVEILDRVAGLLSTVEGKKNESIKAVEGELAEMEKEKATTTTDVEAKKSTAAAKQGECEEKGKVVDTAREAEKAAKTVLSDAQTAEEAFNKKQADLLAEKESFASLLDGFFKPLKEGTLQGNWQKRNKHIGELTKKLKSLGAQESLGEALAATLKMTPEKRQGAFAQKTMEFAEDYFKKHTAKVEADIAGLSTEAASHSSAIANAQAALNDKTAALQVVSKEWDEMQDIWIGLDKEANTANKSLSQIENRIPRVQKNIDKAKADLEKFLELPALFAKLKEHSTTAPAEEEAEEENAEEAKEGEAKEANADEEMQA